MKKIQPGITEAPEQPKPSVSIPLDMLDESLAGAEPGETVDVYAKLRVISKRVSEESDNNYENSVNFEVESIEECGDGEMEMEDEQSSEDLSEDAAEGETPDTEEESPKKPMGKGKGMGVLVMIGGPRKK